MAVKVHLRHLHISPRKVRLVASLVRGMDVIEARNQLAIRSKKSAKPIVKLINSAVASAQHNFEMKEDNLFIEEIFVDEAPTMKRWMPRAHGRAFPIMKRSSHITLVLEEKVKTKKKAKTTNKSTRDDIVKIDDLKKEIEKAKKEEKTEDKKTSAANEKLKRNEGSQARQKEAKGSLQKMFRRKSG